MRKGILVSLVAVAGTAAVFAFFGSSSVPQGQAFLQSNPIDSMFSHYLAKYGKHYPTKEEYIRRRDLFAAQFNWIQESNARNGASYYVGLNRFSDLTEEEFQVYLGDNGQPDQVSTETETHSGHPLSQQEVVPIDWRTKGVVGPVKDQGHCGSCWSFSTIGPIEEHYAIKYGKQLVLAEQQLVDCSWPYGNNGCNGGLFANGYAYVKQYGAELNSAYPYVANDTACTYDSSKVAVRISGTISAIRSADGLKAALMNGPASISLHASQPSFRAYTGGIYNDATCPTSVNHAVQSVGWGTEGGVNYFIVRNSWGPSWGDQGYIKIAETNTDLGICGMLYRVPMQPIIV